MINIGTQYYRPPFPEQKYWEDDFKKMKDLRTVVEIMINKDLVRVSAWQYNIIGATGFVVPVFLLDTNIKSNAAIYRNLTGQLYRADPAYRLMQEIVLGRAGIKIVQALGFSGLKKYHMNEGHAAFAAIELFRQERIGSTRRRIERVKNRCVFTTHTPVAAGHDIFAKSLIKEYISDFPLTLPQLYDENKNINMTLIGMFFSNYVNGVAMKHKEVSLAMFPQYDINAIIKSK